MKEDDQASQWAERVRAEQPPQPVAAETPIEDDVTYERPVTRGDCLTEERPCPFVSCRHHLYLDVTAAGTLKENFPDLEVWEIPDTCSLDVAEKGSPPGSGIGDGSKLEDVAQTLNLTRERVRQIEAAALYKLAKVARYGRGELAQHAADEGFGRTRAPRYLPMVEDDECES